MAWFKIQVFEATQEHAATIARSCHLAGGSHSAHPALLQSLAASSHPQLHLGTVPGILAKEIGIDIVGWQA